MLTGERSLGGSDGAEAVGGEHAGRAGLTRRFFKKMLPSTPGGTNAMSKISVREVLQTLELLSAKNDHEMNAPAPFLRQSFKKSESDKAQDGAAGSKQQASEASGQPEARPLEPQQHAPAGQESGATAPAANCASAAVLKAWRSRCEEGASASRDELQRATSAAGRFSSSGASFARKPGACPSPRLFRGDLRAAPLSEMPTPAASLPDDAGQTVGAGGGWDSGQSVLDAAAVLFPDAVERAERSGAGELPLNAPSTIVRRVIKRLNGMHLRVSHAGEQELCAAAVHVSQDGQEVLWTTLTGSWSSLFVREVKDITLGLASASKLPMEVFVRAVRAQDCAFYVQLPGRSVAFEAETPHLMRLWVVGMLVLLDSAAGIASTVRIWRSLAPRLQPVTAAAAGAALANHAAGAFRFPSSVENFAQQAQKHLPIPDSLITDEPLMAGTFERRVDCAGVVAFVLTSVMLGEHGLSLAHPPSRVEFARCDFRVAGITQSSVEFVSWTEGSASESSDAESETHYMKVIDSFGARHLILLPGADAASDWADGVQIVQELPENENWRRQSSSVTGGVRDVLMSIDRCMTDRLAGREVGRPASSGAVLLKQAGITMLDGLDAADLITSSRHLSEDESCVEGVQPASAAPSAAQGRNSASVLPLAADERTVLDPSPATPGIHEAAFSSRSTNFSASFVKTPSRQPLHDHSGSKAVGQVHAIPSPVQRLTDTAMNGRAPEPSRSASDRADVKQQLHAVQLHDERLRSVSRSALKPHVVERLQSLADSAPMSSASHVGLMRAPALHNSALAEQSQSPAESERIAPLPYAFHSSSTNTTVEKRFFQSTASSPGPARSVHSPSSRRLAGTVAEASGGASSQPMAAAAAQVAARLNSALISFANFDK